MNSVQISCTEMKELAPEFVLGILSVDERNKALEHLTGCSRCSNDVDELANTSDQLLVLSPQAHPPVGFEQRVFSTIKRQQKTKMHWWRYGVAAAVVLGLLAATLLAIRSDSSRLSAAPIRTAFVAGDNGNFTCSTVIRPGNPARITVHVDESGSNETYNVRLRMDDSEIVNLGSVKLDNGKGTLISSASLNAADTKNVDVLDTSGQLHYSAQFKDS
jgi:hypothetical protein